MLEKLKDSKLVNYVCSVGKEVATNYVKETKNSIFEGYTTSLEPSAPKKLSGNEAVLAKHEKYANLAYNSACPDSELDDAYERIDTIENKETGFSSSVYVDKNTNEVVIAYRCTANKEGVAADVEMVEGKLPSQYADAEKVYNDIKAQYPNAKITVVGHSLGGSLAELVASTHKETNAVTFSAFGTSQIIKNNSLKDNKNTVNYATTSDIVCSATPHPGTTRTVDIGSFNYGNIKDGNFNEVKSEVGQAHSLTNYYNLSDAEYVDERKAGTTRILLKELTNLVGNFSKEKPVVAQLVPNFFF